MTAPLLLLMTGVAFPADQARGDEGYVPRRIQIAESKSIADRANTPGIDPQLLTRLDQAAADCKRLAAVDVPKLVADVDKMVNRIT
jgi:hypothetical protein